MPLPNGDRSNAALDLRFPLREFDFTGSGNVPPGVTVVEGPSGAGKTTLLRLIAGLIRPSYGTITLNERTLTGPGVFVPPDQRNLAILFQEYALFPHFDVSANVGYGLRAQRSAGGTRTARAARTRTLRLSHARARARHRAFRRTTAARRTRARAGRRTRGALARRTASRARRRDAFARRRNSRPCSARSTCRRSSSATIPPLAGCFRDPPFTSSAA